MADIFISYSSEDRTKVQGIVAVLTAAGLTVWSDHDLAGGSVFSEEIEKELKAAKIVLAVWTAASLKSRWVADEAEIGRDSGKLIPITLDGSAPPIGFRQYQAIDFTQWDGKSTHDPFMRLLRSIERLGSDGGAEEPTTDLPLTQEVTSPSLFSSFGDKRNLIFAGVGLAVFVLIALLFVFGSDPSNMEQAKIRQPDVAGRSELFGASIKDNASTSIAVLAFVNMSGDPKNEYFSDGITEEILNALAALPDLRVTSRTSSFSFKNSNLELPAIAQALGVGHILEGSVRKDGDQIRITVQLIRASDDAHLWSQTYDRRLTEIFRIQEEISNSIAQSLRVRLLGQNTDSAREVDPVAYDHYLRGLAFLKTAVFTDIDRAIGEFKKATSLDPTLANAFAGEAKALSFSVSTGKEPPVPSLSLAERAAFAALELDSHNANAQAALGMTEFVKRNLLTCLDRYEQAELGHGLSELDYWFYAHALTDAGRFEEAEAMLLRSLERDPLNAGIHFGLAMTFDALAQKQQARTHYQRAVKLEPTNGYYLGWLAFFLASQFADIPSAIEYMQHAIDLDPTDPELYGLNSVLYFSIEDDENADHWLARALEMSPQNSFIRDLSAQYQATRGESEIAVKTAEDVLISGSDFRFGSLRGALTLVGKKPHVAGELENMYHKFSEPLAVFQNTGSLASVALTRTPAAFLGVDLAAVLAEEGRIEDSRHLTSWVIKNLGPRQYSQFSGYQLVKAEALAIEGRDDEALKAIQDIVATENILEWQWRLRDNEHFKNLRNRREFDAVLMTISKHNAKSRADLG